MRDQHVISEALGHPWAVTRHMASVIANVLARHIVRADAVTVTPREPSAPTVAAGVARLPIHGALLVAPPDVERPDFPPVLEGFAPIPRERLPFPSIVVASRNDPFCEFERARLFAYAWGAQFMDYGDCGHINADSGLASWPEGHVLLQDLMKD